MSFIDDMKIGKKMIGGFLIVVLILVVVAAIGYINMGTMDAADTALYEGRTVPIQELASANAATWGVRGDIYKMILLPNERVATEKGMQDKFALIEKDIADYKKSKLTPEEKTSLAEFERVYPLYKAEILKMTDSIKAGDTKYAMASITDGGTVANLRKELNPPLDKMIEINNVEADKLSNSNTALYNSSTMMLIIATIVGVIIAIALALYLSKSITGPLEMVKTNINEFKQGHFGNRMKLNRKDEIGEMADTLDTFANDLQKYVIGTLKMIADGDLSRNLKARNDKDEIVPAFVTITANLRTLVADMDSLSKAAVEGKLDTRADASKHKGDYKKVVEGVNATLDAVIGPLNVSAEYMDRISKGDLPAKITDQYNGDFNEIKNNLNNCIDNINAITADVNMLTNAVVDGKLATRADAARHQGDYKKIVVGMNNCLDSVIGPLNVAADYVDKISKGKMPPKITDPYNGDFNVIKNNLNQCIDAINLLVADANMLSRAAVEGKLDSRADATKHQGDYWQIIAGVNKTLDSIIGPLNVAAEYVDRISKGDMPEKITDNYKGDFNEIKNNLNNCIDNINALVEDATMLARAADEGKLKTRADASKAPVETTRRLSKVSTRLSTRS